MLRDALRRLYPRVEVADGAYCSALCRHEAAEVRQVHYQPWGNGRWCDIDLQL